MIPVKKFQVGNYILDYEVDTKTSIYYRVEEIKKLSSNKLINSHLGVTYRDGSCWTSEPEPVPLTEEILLKCDKYNKHYGFLLNDLTYLNFTFMKDGVYPFIIQEHEISILSSQMVRLERIKHVHQLQNLYFALTQEELEISL